MTFAFPSGDPVSLHPVLARSLIKLESRENQRIASASVEIKGREGALPVSETRFAAIKCNGGL